MPRKALEGAWRRVDSAAQAGERMIDVLAAHGRLEKSEEMNLQAELVESKESRQVQVPKC